MERPSCDSVHAREFLWCHLLKLETKHPKQHPLAQGWDRSPKEKSLLKYEWDTSILETVPHYKAEIKCSSNPHRRYFATQGKGFPFLLLKFSPGWRNLAEIHRVSIKCIVQFSHSVMSDSLWPHEPQNIRPPWPSPTPGVYSNSCPLSWWCHPTISSSVVPFSSCPQSFPTSESFQMSQFFTSSGQSIGASASTSVLPMNTKGWSPLGWTGLISSQSRGLSRDFSNTTVQKYHFFSAQLSL